MTDQQEEVIFTPRLPVPRPRLRLLPCGLCNTAHADWWTNVQAPACVERQLKRKVG